MGIRSSDLAWIVVSDLKKAKKFFSESLGLKTDSASDEHGWLEMSCPKGEFIIGIAQKDAHSPIQPGNNAIITFTVDDVVKTKKELVAKNVQMLGDIMEVPGHVKLQLFKDQDGNHFQLCEMVEVK